jgi:HTH-type transcriptional regulator / antitoxin HigA
MKDFRGVITAASLKLMEIEPIRTHRDYRRTLKEIEGLMHAKRNTPAGDRLDLLVTLVQAWEAKRYPLELPGAVEATRD